MDRPFEWPLYDSGERQKLAALGRPLIAGLRPRQTERLICTTFGGCTIRLFLALQASDK